MSTQAPDLTFTLQIASTAADLARKSALAAAGRLPEFQSASTAVPRNPTAQELLNYDAVTGHRTLDTGARQPVAWDRTAGAWADGKAAAERPPLSAPAQTRGVIYRGGAAYYPAPAGLLADGWNIIDEGATGLYYRATGDVMPWEYGALPGLNYTPTNAGAGLAAWTLAAPAGSRLYLPPGDWWTDRTLILKATGLRIDWRGVLHPMPAVGSNPALTDLLVDADAGHDGGLSYYNTTLKNALWYKDIDVRAMTLLCENQSRGVRFSRWDHFNIWNIKVHKSNGSAYRLDRVREGTFGALSALMCQAGPDVAVADLSEQGPGDTMNCVAFYGFRIAAFSGRALYYDSPHMNEAESVTPALAGPGLPGRFLDFVNLSVEDITKSNGLKFDDAHLTYPDPTSDRVWIRQGRDINFLSGLFNGGDLSTGSALRLGDAALPASPVTNVKVHANFYGFAGTGYALKEDNVVNLDFVDVPWTSDQVKPVRDPASGRVPRQTYQTTATYSPSAQSAQTYLNDGSDPARLGGTPTLDFVDGYGNRGSTFSEGTADGFTNHYLSPNNTKPSTFVLDTNGALRNSKTQLKLGAGADQVAWAKFGPQAGEPYDKSPGTVALSDGVNWKPLPGQAAPKLVMYTGAAWADISAGLGNLPLSLASQTPAQAAALLQAAGGHFRELTAAWSGAAAIEQHPNTSLDGAALTHTGSGVLLYVHDASSSTDETAALTGRTAQVTGRNHTLVGDGSGTALTIGGSSNFWAGALTSYANYYIRDFAAGIVISHNSYMLTFDHGAMTQMPAGSIGVQFQPGLQNAGENVTFRDWYFFNNAGTVIQADGGVGAEIKLIGCSLDYSRLAALVRSYCRVILEQCWIETKDASTPAEYFRVEGGYLGIFDSVMILTGLSHPLVENAGGEVLIRGGRLWKGAGQTRLINDSAGGVSRVEGLSYVTQNGTGEQYDRLGQSASLLGAADATLSGGAALSGNVITLTPAGGDATAKWTVPVRPGQRLLFAYTYQLNALTIGTQPYHAYSAAVNWRDAAGNVISTQQLQPALLGTIAETEGRPNPNLPVRAPARAVSATVSLTAANASSGTVTVRSVEAWVL